MLARAFAGTTWRIKGERRTSQRHIARTINAFSAKKEVTNMAVMKEIVYLCLGLPYSTEIIMYLEAAS